MVIMPVYLTGLTYVYRKDHFDNIATIKRNFEKRFLLDHLKQDFTSILGDLNTRIKTLYFPALIKLYWHYKESGDSEEFETTKALLIQISKENGNEEEINALLEE